MIATMSPPKKRQTPPQPQPRKPVRSGVATSVWLSKQHDAALRSLMTKHRRTLKAQLELLIEQAAIADGVWPPA